jgi:hypothetical protein
VPPLDTRATLGAHHVSVSTLIAVIESLSATAVNVYLR